MTDFRLPDLGEGLTEAEIVAWHVAVGDEVAVDQVVVEVETAKASVEVPIPFAGTVSQLHATVGEVVAVGAPLISVGSVSAAEDAESSEYSGNVLIGYGTSAGRSRRTRRDRRPAPALVAADHRIPSPAAESSRTVAVVSPLVRRMAREADLDLATHPRHGSGRADHAARRRGRADPAGRRAGRAAHPAAGRAQGDGRQAVALAARDPRGDRVGGRRRHRSARRPGRDQRAPPGGAGQPAGA